MKRLHQPWLALGIVLASVNGSGLAYGQAAAQGIPQPAFTAPQASAQAPGRSVIMQAPGKGLDAYPTGATAFPQGHQSPSMIQTASPQGGYATPYGQIPNERPSSQILTPQAGPSAPFVAPGTMGGLPGGGQPLPGGGGPTAPGGAAAGYPFSLEEANAVGAGGALAPGSAYPGSGAGGGAAGMASGFGPSTPAAAAAGAEAFESALAGLSGPGGAGAAESGFTPNMIGDLSPIGLRAIPAQGPPTVGPPSLQPPGSPGIRSASLFAPSTRSVKVAENMSPRPQDRFFADFNYYNNVNSAMNLYDRTPIKNMEVYRQLYGFEKTFDEGRGSFGMRLPINTLTADGTSRAVHTPTRTAAGNLSMFAKYILKEDVKTGSLLSAGLVVTAPTGPGRFAGAPYINGINDTAFQPFVGYILNFPKFYVQGFSAFDFTSNSRDVTLMYNDVGIGYYLFRAQDPSAFLTAVVPTFEAHVNSPFTHRDWKNRFDPAGTADIVNLTYGLNFQIQRSAVLSTALVTPVTGPKPFDAEFVLFVNFFYGRSRAGRIPIQPPPSL